MVWRKRPGRRIWKSSRFTIIESSNPGSRTVYWLYDGRSPKIDPIDRSFSLQELKDAAVRRLGTRARNNPLGVSLLEGALIVGGAALAGVGYIYESGQAKNCAEALLNAQSQANPTPGLPAACMGSGQAIGQTGFFAGLCALGGGLGSLVGGKVGAAIGAVGLPAAAFGIQRLTATTAK